MTSMEKLKNILKAADKKSSKLLIGKKVRLTKRGKWRKVLGVSWEKGGVDLEDYGYAPIEWIEDIRP